MKLIKLLDSHYVIVDDSEIKEGDYKYCPFDDINKIHLQEGNYYDENEFKITHSTQPIEYEWDRGIKDKFFNKIRPLNLSDVEKAISGYGIEEMAFSKFSTNEKTGWGKSYSYDNEKRREGYIAGFKAHQELVKDKLFTVEDMMDAMGFAAAMDNKRPIHHLKEEAEHYIKTKKLPKLEWDCIIVNNRIELCQK